MKPWIAWMRRTGQAVFRSEGFGLALAILAIAGAVSVLMAEWSPTPAQAGGPPMVTSYPVARGPVLDGVVEPLWDAAVVSDISLKRGRRGSEPARTAELRTIYTSDAIYFMVRWPEPTRDAVGGDEQNKLILHFSVPSPWEGADDYMCLVACHTAYVDGQNHGRYVTAETIPPGKTDPLILGGGWQDGYWTLEWGRLLVSENPLDVQFSDLGGAYPFFVKILEGHPNEPDPVSDDLLLGFRTES